MGRKLNGIQPIHVLCLESAKDKQKNVRESMTNCYCTFSFVILVVFELLVFRFKGLFQAQNAEAQYSRKYIFRARSQPRPPKVSNEEKNKRCQSDFDLGQPDKMSELVQGRESGTSS